jgi:hypothetical protein
MYVVEKTFRSALCFHIIIYFWLYIICIQSAKFLYSCKYINPLDIQYIEQKTAQDMNESITVNLCFIHIFLNLFYSELMGSQITTSIHDWMLCWQSDHITNRQDVKNRRINIQKSK